MAIGSIFALGGLAAASSGIKKWAYKNSANMATKTLDSVGSIWRKFIPFYGPGESAVSLTKVMKQGFERRGIQRNLLRKLNTNLKSGNNIFSEKAHGVVNNLANIAEKSNKEKVANSIRKLGKGGFGLDDIGGWQRSKDTAERLLGETLNAWKGGVVGRHTASTADTYVKNALSSYGIKSSAGIKMKSSVQSAYDALDLAQKSKDLLAGPSLGSNLAVLSIPTIGGVATTHRVMKSMSNRMNSVYRGYSQGSER